MLLEHCLARAGYVDFDAMLEVLRERRATAATSSRATRPAVTTGTAFPPGM